MGTGRAVHLERELQVEATQHVAKFFRSFELVVLDPVLNEALGSFLNGWAHELHRLELVQVSVLEQDLEVLQQRLRLSGLHGEALEGSDGVLGAEHAPRGSGGHLRGASDVALLQQTLEALLVQLFRAGETEAAGELEGELRLLQRVAHEGNQVALVDADREDGALSGGHAQDAVGGLVRARREDGVGANALAEEAGAGVQVEQEEVTHLGHHEQDVVLAADLHGDGEVTGGIGGGRGVLRLGL
mmetsp:Transcript_53199/g.78975  ORF Transcript_53199/g.78975 Transcript_53199/m.78975 type:complete len:244 (+) Transcript_53199:3673-4404(+)